MIKEIMSIKSPNFGLPQPLLKLLNRMYANTVPPETTVSIVTTYMCYAILIDVKDMHVNVSRLLQWTDS